MRITDRFATPLPGNRWLLVGTGLLVLGLVAVSVLLSRAGPFPVAFASRNALHPFTISSPDFHDGGALSQKNESNHSGCTGSNIAPRLQWTNVPAGTKSFVLLLSDYDAPVAGGFHHWIVYNIAASAHQLQGNHPFTEGTTSAGSLGYSGPCPPPTGETHHYLFLLYAIDKAQIGAQGLTFDAVVSALAGHVLGATSIIGTFHLPQ